VQRHRQRNAEAARQWQRGQPVGPEMRVDQRRVGRRDPRAQGPPAAEGADREGLRSVPREHDPPLE